MIRSDGKPLRDAFRLRDNEEYLSANWLEYFHDSDRAVQIAGVRQALVGKGFRVARAARFAVLNVGDTIRLCRELLNVDIRFVALGEPHDPSHTGIYLQMTQNNPDFATLLAKSVGVDAMYPAAT